MLDLVIVEDEEIIRRGLICTIDWLKLGAKVVGEAGNGQEALEVIREKKPDVVLTDIKMPIMDGIALTEALRAEGNPAKLIYLTSYADFSYAQQALRLEVSDYLLKPVNEEDLGKALMKLEKPPEAPKQDELSWDEGLKAAYHTGNPYVQAALKRIEGGYQNRLSSETLADELGVSASYLSRKLKEETGATPKRFTELGPLVVSPGAYGEVLYLYLAEGLDMGETSPDEDEFLDLIRTPFDKMVRRVMDGELTDAKTVAGVLKVYALRQRGQ